MAITIKKVSSKKELKTFIRFNYELSLYARKYSASQNSKAAFFFGLNVFSISSYKSGTE